MVELKQQFPIVDDEVLLPTYTTSGAATGYFNLPLNVAGDIYWVTRFFSTKMFRFSAATNDLYVKILGARTKDSNGNYVWSYTAYDETLVAVSAPINITITGLYLALKVQVKRATDDDMHNGTLSAYFWGTSLL